MSAQFETPGSGALPVSEDCPLCGGQPGAAAERCPACGYHLAGIDGRPGPLDRAALFWTAAGLALVYALAALVVLGAR